MEWALFGVVGVITLVAAGAFSKKLGVAAPLILIVLGVGFSFIPGAPTRIDPNLILLGLLPPILYSAAITVPVIDFRRNLSSITALSVALVVVTALVSGVILWLIFPDLSLAGGIAIGAVISPTDAVAATALGKKLGLPPRMVTILEGEGLVNDATALVLLRSAVAATAATVGFWDIIVDFLFAASLAIVIGLVVGIVTVFIRSKLHDPILDTAISFAVPFIAFIPAEELHASGVLAVVVAGLYSGHNSAKHFSAQARINERLNWRTAQFLLENGVFLLMGVEITALISDVHKNELSADKAIYIGLLMTVVVIIIRFLFMGPLVVTLRKRAARADRQHSRFTEMMERVRAKPEAAVSEKRIERVERAYARSTHDLKQLQAEGLGWRGGLVLGWSGMRGVVTLAAAQSLPTETPYRSQLVLIAFTVAIVTLLLQGGTLPWLIRKTGIRGTDKTADRRELATLLDEMTDAGLSVLENPNLLDGEDVDPAVVERVRQDALLSTEAAWERAEHGGRETGLVNSPHQQYRALRREIIEAERQALLDARASGSYPSRILTRAQMMLDLEETRLEQLDNPSGS